jgi:hypothetical protein
MKVLSIRQPWAALIVAGIKDIENRNWPTRYRGPLLIHAAQRPAHMSDHEIARTYRCTIPATAKLRGGIVGIVELIDCVGRHRSKWFEGDFGFVLRNARPLPFVPMPGRLGLFDPSPAITVAMSR